MGNGFQFQRFKVDDALCAMKVGTDGVLLGAWARGGRRILDIGTGSGLIALFMAQRFNAATITAIDIDPQACQQAIANAKASPYGNRIEVVATGLQQFGDDLQRFSNGSQQFSGGEYDSIVCNPPFFNGSLPSPDSRRSLARHTTALPFADLARHAVRLMSNDGELSVVLPAACKAAFDTEAVFAGLYASRICALKTVPHKPVSRYLLAYRKQRCEVETTAECLNNADMTRSNWYAALTADFYLPKV